MAAGCSQHLIHQLLFFLLQPSTQTCSANGEEREAAILHLFPKCIFVWVNFPNKLWSCPQAALMEFLLALFSTFESCAKPKCI
jgi:hypothetical protein